MTFRVIPMAFIMINEDITEMGRVTPVITMERQELMKMKTIKTVRIPPMSSVSSTSASEWRVMMEASRTSERDTFRGQLLLHLVHDLLDIVHHLHLIGTRLLVDVEADGRQTVDEGQFAPLFHAVGDARHFTQGDGPPCFWAITMSR